MYKKVFPDHKIWSETLLKIFFVMKLAISILLFTAFQVKANHSSAQNISLSVNNAEIRKILKIVEKDGNVRFLFDADLKEINKKVDFFVNNVSVNEALNVLFAKTNLTYKVLNTNLFVVVSTVQEDNNAIIVNGKVTDEKGNPLAAASINIKGTNRGTSTNAAGEFAISANEDAILVISYVGYEISEVEVGSRTTINVSLKPAVKLSEQVVIIGYGTSRKKDLTGASASVSGADIINVPVLTATQAIQGKVAGVQITNSGAPGSTPNVRIRGVGSILGGADPLYIVDGIITDDIRNINAADIVSLDVLKDASSTAIYGARAANGVILITTKAGNRNKFAINYNAYAGVKLLTHKVEMAGPNLFTLYSNAAANAPAIINEDITGATNWYDEITRPAIFQNHNLSVSGGKNKYRYFVSGGYLNENGTLIDNNYQRYTIRLNHDFTISRKLKIGNNLAYSHYISNNKPYGLFTTAYIAAPIFNARNSDGTWSNTNKSNVGNPLASLKELNDRSYGDRATGSLWGEYQIIKGLSFRSSFGIDLEQNNGWAFVPEYATYLPNGQLAGQQNEKSDLRFNRDSIYHWTWDNFFTYEKKFGTAHNFKLTAGHTSERKNGWSQVANINNGNIVNDKSSWQLNFTDTAGGQVNEPRRPIGNYYRRESYFLRANYSYLDKYLFSSTYRRDGNSNFPKSNRWGNFYSVGLGWIISNEGFMKNQKVFDLLKLRASYGEVGNDVVAPGSFDLIPSEQYFSYFGSNRINGATITGIKDPNLQWEVVKEFDLGVEFKALRGRLTGEIDYYHKKATKALYRIPLPSLGFGDEFITNAADILNQGVELSLGWNNGTGNKINYTVRGNVTFNKNKVESIGAGQAIVDGGLGNGTTSTKTTVGQAIGEFWVYKTNGIFQNQSEVDAYPHLQNTQPGDFRIDDTNKDGLINEDDKVFVGSYQPKMFYGLSASVSWRKFDFSMDVFGNLGNKVYNAKKGVRFGGNYNLEYDIAKNYWQPGSNNNKYPRAFNGSAPVSDYFVESGSYIRINNLTAGYTFKMKSQHNPFQNLRVYLSAQNPFIYTKYTGFTPELPGTPLASGIELNVYPIAASYMVGVNLQLK